MFFHILSRLFLGGSTKHGATISYAYFAGNASLCSICMI